jgi:Glycosyl hydrolase 36 superfamily, catalytic domain/Glycosyltransferase family 36
MVKISCAIDVTIDRRRLPVRIYRIVLAAIAMTIISYTGCIPSPGTDEIDRCTIIPEHFDPESLFDLQPVFCEDHSGSGSFGTWQLDRRGLPAYRYSINQYQSTLGNYFNTEGDSERTDQWHGFGNDRIIAIAHNDGTVESFNTDRGYKYLNKIDPESGNFGGGFAYIDDGGDLYGSHYQPDIFVRYERTFVMGGYEIVAERGDLLYERRTFAPYGDDPFIAAEISLTNLSGSEKTIRYYEFWDVNVWQNIIAPIASDSEFPGALAGVRAVNREFNSNFNAACGLDENNEIAYCSFEPKDPGAAPNLEAYGLYDYWLPDVILTFLDDGIDYFATDGAAFFADGGMDSPAGIEQAAGSAYQGAADGMPPVLVLGRELTLQPGEKTDFTSLFGHVGPTSSLSATEFVGYYRANPPSWDDDGRYRADFAPFIATGRNTWSTRELAWHGDSLISLVGYEESYENHATMQGSAYLFLQGAQGAPRDLALYNIPLTALRPDLAREVLHYVYRMTLPDGQISYATGGLREVGGLGVHNSPSDLDIFLIWMLAEYLLATRDFGHLDEKAPFYPDTVTSSTVLDHISLALDHLENVVGFGENGLLRLLDGDWNDGIIQFSDNSELTKEVGESGFNTAFACYALPLLADALECAGGDALAAAAHAAELASKSCAGLNNAFTGEWYLRGFTEPDKPFGADRPWLEPQVFALLSTAPTADGRKTIVDNLREHLIAPSPIGAMIVHPAYPNGIWPEGWDVNGGVWAALNGLLVWALAAEDPQLSYEQFEKSSLKGHAEAYPDIWYGIWTGPDSYNAHYAERPGEAFYHVATAMSDFPAMNANQNALPLLAALKSLGWKPIKEGIEINPLWQDFPLIVKTKLAGWAYTTRGAAFYYNAITDAKFNVRLALPPIADVQTIRVFVNGEEIDAAIDVDFVVVPLDCRLGQQCRIVLK